MTKCRADLLEYSTNQADPFADGKVVYINYCNILINIPTLLFHEISARIAFYFTESLKTERKDLQYSRLLGLPSRDTLCFILAPG